MDYDEILGSDSEFEDDMYYGKDDGMYADHLLKEFADRLYRNFNDPGRMMRRARSSFSWEGKCIHLCIYKRSLPYVVFRMESIVTAGFHS